MFLKRNLKKRKLKKVKKEKANGNKSIPSKRTKRTFWCWNDGMQKALVEVEGDIEKALDLLRSNSALKAEKKSARVAADGVIKVHVSENYATMVEINSKLILLQR